MRDWANADIARAGLVDPHLSSVDLAVIAAMHPWLWTQVAVHPAAFPQLLEWLAVRGVVVSRKPTPCVRPEGRSATGSPSHAVLPEMPPTPRTRRRKWTVVIMVVVIVVMIALADLGVVCALMG